MNELIEWFPQLNALDLKAQAPQVTTMMKSASFLQSLNAHGLSLQSLKSESSIFFIYIILGVITKRSVYPLAFFMCFLLVNASVFQAIKEYQVYLFVMVIYSYVFSDCPTKQSKYACVTICLLSLCLAIDAFLYGTNGYHGTRQTILWENIEYLAACAHIIFICSFVSIERIRNDIRKFISSASRIALNSDYMLFSWYTIYKIQSNKQKT